MLRMILKFFFAYDLVFTIQPSESHLVVLLKLLAQQQQEFPNTFHQTWTILPGQN